MCVFLYVLILLLIIKMSAPLLDPYVTLGLRRDADLEAIRRAYRTLSMRWHPDRVGRAGGGAGEAAVSVSAAEKFSNIAEAFDVLSSPSLRALLDKQGLVALGQSYTFTKDPQTMFCSFFGTGNPFAVLQEKAREGAARAAANPPAQVVALACSLEELYCGCVKRPSVSRMVATADGMDVAPEDVTMDVVIKPGYGEGTSITFRGQGDRLPGMKASDLTFLVTERKHEIYSRQGDDLVHCAKINLAQALGACELLLRTLDGRVITVDCNHVLDPSSVVTIKGEGMCGRGDLIVHFDIAFPKHLATGESEALTRILAPKFRAARK